MIVNIIYNSTGILIKSNADERDIHASGKTAANSRREKFGGHIFPLISTTGCFQAVSRV